MNSFDIAKSVAKRWKRVAVCDKDWIFIVTEFKWDYSRGVTFDFVVCDEIADEGKLKELIFSGIS